jgi:hypothetical protein
VFGARSRFVHSGHAAAAPPNSVMNWRRFTARCLPCFRTKEIAHRGLLRCGIAIRPCRLGSIASDRNASYPRRMSASPHVCGRREPVGDSHCGKNRTLRDSISLPQLVFLPRAEIAGNATIFSPRWTMNAS